MMVKKMQEAAAEKKIKQKYGLSVMRMLSTM